MIHFGWRLYDVTRMIWYFGVPFWVLWLLNTVIAAMPDRYDTVLYLHFRTLI